MSRLDSVLLLILMLCSLAVVNATYQQRRVFAALERAHSQERRLNQDWARLQYEQGALSQTSRVEEFARRKLGMDTANTARVQYVKQDGTALPLTAPPPASTLAASLSKKRP